MAYVTGSEPLYYNQRVNSTIAWRDYALGEATRGGALNLARANAYKPLDEGYATAARAQGASYATAEKTYWTSWYEQGEQSLPPENPLQLARDVSKADADLAQVTSQGTADVTWTAGIVAGDDVYRSDRATAVKTYQTTLADIDRDTIVARASLDEAHLMAYVAAQTAYWTAEVAAETARRTAATTAQANYFTADYGAQATAIAGIDAAVNLPWTAYQADLGAAMSGWWINDENANYLALATAANAAELAYQATVNAAFTTWVSQRAGAEKSLAIGEANTKYVWLATDYAADESYALGLTDAEGDWQAGRAINLKNRRAEFWTDRRDAIAARDTTFVQTWELLAMMPDPANVTVDREYTIAESIVAGDRRTGKATSWRDNLVSYNPIFLNYVQSVALADETFDTAEATATADRTAALAAAVADHQMARSQSLEDAITALAANQSPWAVYDAAFAAIYDDYVDAVAPAARDSAIAIADAEKTFAISHAQAIRIRDNATAPTTATYHLSVANADLSRSASQSVAETAAAQTLPMNVLAGMAQASAENEAPSSPGSPQQGTTSSDGGANTSTTCCSCADTRPTTLPTPATPNSTQPTVTARIPGDHAPPVQFDSYGQLIFPGLDEYDETTRTQLAMLRVGIEPEVAAKFAKLTADNQKKIQDKLQAQPYKHIGDAKYQVTLEVYALLDEQSGKYASAIQHRIQISRHQAKTFLNDEDEGEWRYRSHLNDLHTAKCMRSLAEVPVLVGSAGEVVVGVGAAMTPTGVGQVFGYAMIVHGTDNFQASGRSMLLGTHQPSETAKMITDMARGAGYRPENAKSLGEIGNTTIGVLLPVGSSLYVLRSGSLANVPIATETVLAGPLDESARLMIAARVRPFETPKTLIPIGVDDIEIAFPTTWQEHEALVTEALMKANPGLKVGRQVTFDVMLADGRILPMRIDNTVPVHDMILWVDAKFSSVVDLSDPSVSLAGRLTPNQTTVFPLIANGEIHSAIPRGMNARLAGFTPGKAVRLVGRVDVHVNGANGPVARPYP